MRYSSVAILLIGLIGSGAWASDASRGEDLLRSKHLEKVKGHYVLKEAEEEALTKMTEYRAAHEALVKAKARTEGFEQAEQMLKATNQEMANVGRLMNSLRSRSGNLPRRHSALQAQQHMEATAELQEAQVYHNQLQGQVNELKGLQPKGNEKKTAAADLKKAQDELATQTRVAREALDPVIDLYHEMAADKEVKIALEAIRIETKAMAKVSPSPRFLETVKLVEGSKVASQLASMKPGGRSRSGVRP